MSARWGGGSIRHAHRRKSDGLSELAGLLWVAIAVLVWIVAP